MGKSPLLVFWLVILPACTHSEWLSPDASDANRGYFADALNCRQSALRTEAIKVPTAHSMSIIEVPTTYDAGKFVVCMEYAGRPVSRVDLSDYLTISSVCLNEARNMANPDDAYADCIQRSRLNVEIITDK